MLDHYVLSEQSDDQDTKVLLKCDDPFRRLEKQIY